MGEKKTKSTTKTLVWRCVACGHSAPVEQSAARSVSPGDVELCPSCEDGAGVAMTPAMEAGFVESLARGASDLDALDRALAIGGLRAKKKPSRVGRAPHRKMGSEAARRARRSSATSRASSRPSIPTRSAASGKRGQLQARAVTSRGRRGGSSARSVIGRTSTGPSGSRGRTVAARTRDRSRWSRSARASRCA